MAIYAKLLEFQRKNIKVERDATNPHFRSKYSTLNEVLDKVKGSLNELGVVIVQKPVGGLIETNRSIREEAGLQTRLIDTEDESEVECFVPFVGATDMQKLGGAITYARRYSLVTLLGLEDEDDDGNAASAPNAPRAVQRPTAAPAGPVQRNDEPFGNTTPASVAPLDAADLDTINLDDL